MSQSKFDEEKYIEDVLEDAKAFAALVDKLNKELREIVQMSTVQRLAYKGLDAQITNTLVDLSTEFKDLNKEVSSNNPENIEYHLKRIQTLANDGKKDLGKALDITQQKKFEGTDILEDIKRTFTHFIQWAGKMLGLFNKHSSELQDAMKKKSGGVIGIGAKSQLDRFKEVQDSVGIQFSQKGHALGKNQERLLDEPDYKSPKNK